MNLLWAWNCMQLPVRDLGVSFLSVSMPFNWQRCCASPSLGRHNWYKEFMLVNLGQDFDVYLYQDQNVAICDDIRALMLE